MIRKLPENIVVAYSQKGKDTALSVANSAQLALFNVRAVNNCGSAISVGILRKLILGKYKLWTLTTGGTVYTDISPTTSTLGNKTIFTATNDDGFIVQSERRMGLIGVTVGTAQAGGSFTYTYWNGSSFSSLTTIENPTDYSATGDKYIVFRLPYDAVVGGPANSGLSSSMYSIRIAGSTAPAGNVVISALWIGEFLDLYSGVANNSAVQLSFPDSKPFELNATEGIFPYFSTAHAANQFGAYYCAV